ncbi:hypothetical protein [Sulfurimonas denitrificans]|jgi:hypothetical protein|uniref:hypothetical protein n=1 Tax=Sulfurimonas denitrificans TaxID=39766 RepID=UPI0002DE8AAE|nr:hypothetical protein [Sulfurimonas denitrificans]MDD3442175.1 hypothetical protein [Sulfurimonas denitrificans]
MPPDFSIRAIILPTRIAKERVCTIQASCNRDTKRENIFFNDGKTEKSFKINPPRTIPPKSESRTFLLYSAKAIARSEGRRESAESSMSDLSKLYRE